MSFVTLAEAKLHLRVDGTDEDALIGLYINAAEQAAIKALDRGVYADNTALQTAMTAAPAELTAAYPRAKIRRSAITIHGHPAHGAAWQPRLHECFAAGSASIS